MKKILRCLAFVVVLVSLLVIMLPNPVSAIQNGSSDGNNHPFVCLVVFFDADYTPLWRTTGELISPTVVLTAGHGTYGTTYASVWFDSTIPASSLTGYPYYGTTGYDGIPHTISTYKAEPTPGLPGFDYHDVGVVVLDEPVPTNVVSASDYGLLPSAGDVDALNMMASIDLVGYGVTSQIRGKGITPDTSWTWDRQRNYAPAAFIKSSGVLSSEFMKLTANPGNGKGGTTFGDSGGPILEAGTTTILGINSFVTNYNCDGVTYAQRIDITDILSWINTFID